MKRLLRIGPIAASVGALLILGSAFAAEDTVRDVAVADAAAELDATATPLAKDEVVTITKHQPTVGDKETRTRLQTLSMKGNLVTAQTKVEKSKTETVEKTEECLEVKAAECVKLKVTYKTDTETTVLNGRTATTANPNQGKSYIVERGATPRVTAEDGSTPSEAEVKSVSGGYKKPPRNQRFLAALPEKVKEGDSLTALAKELAAVAAESNDKPKVDATVVVKGFGTVGGKKVVVLDVRIFLDGKTEASRTQIEFKGTIEVLVEGGHPVRSSLGGPITAELLKDGGTLKGTIQETSTSTYQWK